MLFDDMWWLPNMERSGLGGLLECRVGLLGVGLRRTFTKGWNLSSDLLALKSIMVKV